MELIEMFRQHLWRAAVMAALAVLLIAPAAVSAHQEATAGNYIVEYGWVSEPALVGQPNALVLNFRPAAAGAPPAGSISIVSPASMADVKGGSLDVTVKVAGLESAAPGSVHWHLAVDGQEIAMAPLSQTTVSVNGLGNGMHTVTASLASNDHGQIGQPASTMVTISGSGTGNAPAPGAIDPMQGMDMSAPAYTIDVSALKVEVDYGGQSKILTLQPLADGGPGQYTAPFVPTRAGQYTVKLSGKLAGSAGASDVDVSINPEDVDLIDAYAFPLAAGSGAASSGLNLGGWLGLGGLAAGLGGLALGAAALLRKR